MISSMIVADLHNHSTVSDGEYTPSELVLQAHEMGLKAIALTDHDTIAGLDEAVEAGRKSGIKVIPLRFQVCMARRPPNSVLL